MPIAVQFSEYGTSDVLRVVDVLAPVAGPGQVRIAVRAVSVNPVDWKILQGALQELLKLDFPAGLGKDVAGVVDQVGDGVTAFAVGDEVLGSSSTPSYAQFALADPAALVTRPADVSWEVAGSLAGAGGTAWKVLDLLGVATDETLLIHAAAGGVGVLAVQLAVARGVRVIGTASESNHELLRSLGAIPITYGDGLADRVRAVAPQGVDAVLDASGRGELPVSIELAGGPERVLTIAAFDAADHGIRFHVGGGGEDTVQAIQDILALIKDGRLQVPIWRTYPLTEAAAALEASRAGHLGGKIVLLPA
ncbi:NADP-dependent oxidoreductase [Protofrankia symbiont of Coriaria ruscifolia]|uniref:NADP-dependent oxidoreductase n=1 Tax=Protofrankia symbiont of Coriaria ruscifolia TaxID=1306542 RepID=UPI0010418E27|nr:NADP-dependent oxidoreductase [Protofrankia symbiont of Coriaria ruscifolia]